MKCKQKKTNTDHTFSYLVAEDDCYNFLGIRWVVRSWFFSCNKYSKLTDFTNKSPCAIPKF